MNGLSDLVPVPLAAPETAHLRAARLRVMLGFALLALIVLFFAPLRALAGSAALAALVACASFVLIQGWQWLRAKNAADDAWLMREKNDAA